MVTKAPPTPTRKFLLALHSHRRPSPSRRAPPPSWPAPPIGGGPTHPRSAGRRRSRAPAPPAPAAARWPRRTPPCRPPPLQRPLPLPRANGSAGFPSRDRKGPPEPLWDELGGGTAPSGGRSASSRWFGVLHGCLAPKNRPKSSPNPPESPQNHPQLHYRGLFTTKHPQRPG